MSSSRCKNDGADQRSAPFIPFVTILFCGAALAIAALPSFAPLLDYDRAALASGELWRLITGHFVHWSRDHLLWDVGTFAALGAFCEARGRRLFLATCTLSLFAISAFLWVGLPSIEVYRGLSGVDNALFALLAIHVFREQRLRGRRRAVLVGALAVLGFGAKLAFEVSTGGTVFVEDAGVDVVSVPLAHVAGLGSGLVATWLRGSASAFRIAPRRASR